MDNDNDSNQSRNNNSNNYVNVINNNKNKNNEKLLIFHMYVHFIIEQFLFCILTLQQLLKIIDNGKKKLNENPVH